MNDLAPYIWHELPEQEVVRLLESDRASGLTQAEVEARQRKFGRNEMTARQRMSEWKRFLLQFAQPLMYILLLASAVTLVLGEHVDSAVIFAGTFVNALVGFFQEGKAGKAIEALSKMVLTEATVRRDGRKQRVNSMGLVPGDVVLLQSGDKVPADMRLLHVRSLQVDESALTGESVPVEKHAGALAHGAVLAERKNLAFGGTLVTYGQAEGVVLATGNHTETGRIARLIHEAADLSTPLTRKIAQFSKLVRGGDRLKVEGDPTEAALIVAAQKAGLDAADTHSAHPRLDVIPFESEHQFMAALHSRGAGKARVIFKKGSVERLLERCSHALRDDGELAPLDAPAIHAAIGQMAARGLRVLAFARREVAHDHDPLHHDHVREGLTFLGLQGMIDPPRAEAIVSVRKCQEAGIQVKMITGAHALTARSIAQQLGLRGGSDGELIAVTGRELENISDTDLPELAGLAAMLGAQLLFTHAPLMNRLFHTAPLDAASWLYVTGVGLAAYCIVELEKWARRKLAHAS